MKKNLDTLFQEKLTDLHELPDEMVWEAIQASLDKKKKSRRILPLWWTLGGAAALLAIFFYVKGATNFDLDANSTISDRDQNKNVPLIITEENQTSVSENEVRPLKNTESKEDYKNSVNKEEQQEFWAETSNNKAEASKSGTTLSKKTALPTTAVENQNTIEVINNKKPSNASNISGHSHAVAENETRSKNYPAATAKTPMPNAIGNMDNDKIAKLEPSNPETPEGKKSIYDEIKAQSDETEIAENGSKKWSLAPSVAPVYFNGFGSGSPIHPEFSSNSKSGNVNLSYGVFVAYEVTKRLQVRTGIHKVDYGYNTDDVAFTSSFAASSNNSLSNIDYASNAGNIILTSTVGNKPTSNIQGEISGKTPSKNGSMIQQFGYLEVPLELNYALLDKDFGISLVGGFSSLFLTNNAILLETDGLNTQIGEANNINDINFSSNIGLGFNYKFTPKLRLDIEPVFKYQLNTFSNTAGDFQPFSIGIYSGFNFKF